MKKCIVTGAAGYFVYCVAHPHSQHNKRLEGIANIKLVYADMADMS